MITSCELDYPDTVEFPNETSLSCKRSIHLDSDLSIWKIINFDNTSYIRKFTPSDKTKNSNIFDDLPVSFNLFSPEQNIFISHSSCHLSYLKVFDKLSIHSEITLNDLNENNNFLNKVELLPIVDLQLRLVEMQDSKPIDETIQELYSGLRIFLTNEKYNLCDLFIASLPFERMNIDILGATLTYTFPWKEYLPSRANFFYRTKSRFNESMPIEETEEILSFLE
jgi:hypothetical protein